MDRWLLESSVADRIQKAQLSELLPSIEYQNEFLAFFDDDETKNGSRILSIVGDTAEIKIHGVITQRPSFFAMLFGGGNTLFGEIISALASADQDPNVQQIILNIDSPGGTVAGLFDTLGAIQHINKRIVAHVESLAASAAFAIASQADEIIASNISSRFGSVGVVVSVFIDENEIDITSTEAPKKAPDASTKEGQAMIREELDDIHAIFAGSIAEGRKTTIARVNKDFGRGGIFLAQKAKDAGMIDSISDKSFRLTAPSSSIKSEADEENQIDSRGKHMDLEKLKAEHRSVYDECVKAGVDKERDRVKAHLTMGSASGDMKTATEAIENGEALTEAIQAKHLAARMNSNDLDDKGGDDAGADAALDNADTDIVDKDDASTKQADAILAAMGPEKSNTEGVA